MTLLYPNQCSNKVCYKGIALYQVITIPGRLAQSVKCLATDESLDPGIASLIPAESHTFEEIDHEISSMSFSSLPLNRSRRVVVSYKRKYVHGVLVNCLFKLVQEKCG